MKILRNSWLLLAASFSFVAAENNQQQISAVFNPEHLTAQEMINAGDQPVLRFTLEKGAPPVALITDPRKGGFYIFEFGVRYPQLDNKVVPVKTADDLLHMEPLRHQAFFDYVKQFDHKFDGFRKLKAPISAVIEDAMQLAGLLEAKEYTGTFFKDEYVAGMPMIISVANVEQLRALQAYFVIKGIQPRAEKPWLLLEIFSAEALSQADVDFWSRYFILIKRSDAGVEELLRNERDFRRNTAETGCKGSYITHSVSEVFLLKVEGLYKEFKNNELMLLAAMGLGGVVWNFTKDKVFTPAYVKVKNTETLQTALDKAPPVAKWTLGVAAVYTLFRLWLNTVNTSLTEAEKRAIKSHAHQAKRAAGVLEEETLLQCDVEGPAPVAEVAA